MLDMNKKITDNTGSITVETALVFPLVILLIFCFCTLMHMTYMHGMVQIALNETCEELSYDAYLLDQLDIVDAIQQKYDEASTHAIAAKDLEQLYETTKNFNNIVFDGDYPEFKDIKVFYETCVKYIEFINEVKKNSQNLKGTLETEGVYFLDTIIGRKYFENSLRKKLGSKNIHLDYTFKHLEIFMKNDTGKVVIEYNCNLPINFFDILNFNMSNSSYVKIFNGQGNYKAFEKEKDVDNEIVYITPNGNKYHTNKKCWHIYVEKQLININKVGNKRPCKKCCKNMRFVKHVYTTKNDDSVYHKDKNCTYLEHNIKEITLKEAIGRGMEKCEDCP